MKPSKLEVAIRTGNLEKVRQLIADEVDVSVALADGTKPIQLAAREGQVTIVRALAAAGADLDDLEVLSFPERLKLFVDSSLDEPDEEDLLSASELSIWAMQGGRLTDGREDGGRDSRRRRRSLPRCSHRRYRALAASDCGWRSGGYRS